MLEKCIFFYCLLGFTFGESLEVPEFQNVQILSAMEAVKLYMKEAEVIWNRNSSCKTWVFVTNSDPIRETITKFQEMENNVPITIVSNPPVVKYFDKEHTLDELLFPLYSGPHHHTPQCQSVFLFSSESSSQYEYHANYLADSRIARLHKDYFFFIGYEKKLLKFSNSLYVNDIRYKYFVDFEQNSIEIEDGCNNIRYGAPPSLFTQKCESTLREKKFIGTSVFGTPWLSINVGSDRKFHSAGGIYYRLLEDSAIRYNFTFLLQYANSGGASGFKRGGLWYGAVGEIYRRTADLALGCGTTSNRDPVIDNGIACQWVSRVFFIKVPPLKTNWKAIFSPFQYNVWILIGFIALSLSPVYYLSYKWWQFLHKPKDRQKHKTSSAFTEVVSTLLTVILEQSSSDVTWKGLRLRLLIFSWMFFCLVMGAGYRSRLIFFLTFIIPQSVPTTHDTLMQNDYRIYFRYYGGIAYRFAAQSSDPIQREITRRAILINSSSEHCIIEAILTEGSACLDWEPHGSFAVVKNATINAHQTNPLMSQSKDSVMDIMVAWLYRKWSPLTESFDMYISKTMAVGLYLKWEGEWYAEHRLKGARWHKEHKEQSLLTRKLLEIYKDDSAAPKPLQLSSLIGVFLLELAGLLLAILIFLAQRFIALWKTFRCSSICICF